MTKHRQSFNGSGIAKQRLRQQETRDLPRTVLVLEGFAGAGELYRTCWSGWRGYCLDERDDVIRRAAIERPDWGCYQGDTERALRFGFMAHVPFGVVDLDCFGSPWRFLVAWLESDRERAETTRLFLTDGHMAKVGICATEKTLFPGLTGDNMRGMSHEEYLQTVDMRLAEWGEKAGLSLIRHRTIKDKNMRLHYLTAKRSP
jgi:hypothetical protein